MVEGALTDVQSDCAVLAGLLLQDDVSKVSGSEKARRT
jgi:hypothetical protein